MKPLQKVRVCSMFKMASNSRITLFFTDKSQQERQNADALNANDHSENDDDNDDVETNDEDDESNLDDVDMMLRFQLAVQRTGRLFQRSGDRNVIHTGLHFSDLPMEIVLYILKWVVSADLDLRSLEQCSAVCKGFYICSKDHDIWRLACLKYAPLLLCYCIKGEYIFSNFQNLGRSGGCAKRIVLPFVEAYVLKPTPCTLQWLLHQQDQLLALW